MCGIAGIWHWPEKMPEASQEELLTMQRHLTHRGPDDQGIYRDGSLGLTHTRLAILDLTAAGHQPFVSSDGRHVLVFNGEIYNFRELREEYLRDVQFVSQSDTEVLLHMLLKMREGALPLLQGMFAFAWWDREKQELFLAVDRFGKKPLYFIKTDTLFAFASEPKALFKQASVAPELDQSIVAPYFLHEYVPPPRSGFRNIHRLEMGQYLLVTRRELAKREWWRPKFTPKKKITEKEALAKLDTLLGQAVARRMVADVPVGIFLSGGLDSTTIAWYMKRIKETDIHSCSVGFEEPSFNESAHATLAANQIGTHHHELVFKASRFRPAVQELLSVIDVPLADASLMPTYELSKLARGYMTVVLDGDGGDEIFGGYGTFLAADVSAYLDVIPSDIWRIIAKASRYLPTSYKYFSWDFKLKMFLRGMAYPLPYRNQVWLGSFHNEEMRELLETPYQPNVSDVFQTVDAAYEQCRDLTLFDQISYLTIRHYLQGDLLPKIDRATMAVSLEARTPFLDTDLVEFVMQLPVALKKNKRLLRQLMRGRIPDSIIDRPKQGFGIPLGLWLQDPLYEWAARVLHPTRISRVGVVRSEYVQKLLAEHKAKKANHRKKLWTIITFQLWYERWILQLPVEEIV